MHSARAKKLDLNLTPYLRDVIDAWDFKGTRREITVCAPEQTGKTLAWLIGLLWTFVFEPCLSLVCYESDDKAEEINTGKFMPLMQAIPELAAELSVPKSKRKDRYKFSNLTSLFQGSGKRISSVSARVAVGDEIDDWQEHEGEVDNLDDIRKRNRSFADSLLAKVCTVKGSDVDDKNGGVKGSKIWAEFKNSSRGYWFLRCQKCGKLTIKSCDIHHLNFKRNKDKNLVIGSCRLVCPECKHSHVEADKFQMNQQGAYIHEEPNKLQGKEPHYGFQWGALASCWESLSWEVIAKAQIKAGKSGRLKDQLYFDNSIRGLPFKMRSMSNTNRHELLKHCTSKQLSTENIEAVFVTVDTQDYGWKWEVRALGVDSCRYQIAYGFSEYLELDDDLRQAINEKRRLEARVKNIVFSEVVTVQDVLEREYYGVQPILMLIDSGGHRKYEVYTFVAKHERVYAYKGDNKIRNDWKFSETQDKLIIVREKEYKSQLLYLLYQYNNTEKFYWYFVDDNKITSNYLDELAAMQPDLKRGNEGRQYENYIHCGMHDYFDTSKMYLALEAIAISELPFDNFEQGKAEILNLDDDEPTPENQEQPPVNNSSMPTFTESWSSGWKF